MFTRFKQRVARWPEGSRGFTLVELLVVIAIISILATVLLLQLGAARSKGRDAKRIADINQVRTAIELYFDDNAQYPQTNDLSTLTPTYLTHIPLDPLATGCTTVYNGTAGGGAQCYGYAYSGTTKYQVWAELENNNKNALKSDADINSTGWSGAAVNGATEACTSANSDCVFDLGQP